MKNKEKMNSKSVKLQQKFPAILNGYVREVGGSNGKGLPRRITQTFHGMEIPGWLNQINLDGTHGSIEKKRLKLYLNRWRDQRKKPLATSAARLRMQRGTWCAGTKTRAYKALDELVKVLRDINRKEEPTDIGRCEDFEDEDSEHDAPEKPPE